MRIVMLGENEDAGTVRVLYRSSVGRDTIDGKGRFGECQGVGNNDTPVCLEHDGIAKQVGCPGVPNVLMLHVGDDRIVVCRGFETKRRLEGSRCVRQPIGRDMCTEINEEECEEDG